MPGIPLKQVFSSRHAEWNVIRWMPGLQHFSIKLSNCSVPMKYVPCVANILYISTKAMPLCSPSSPSNSLNYPTLVQLSIELADLIMLFILQLPYTASNVPMLNEE